MTFDLIIRGGVCVLPWGEEQTDVGVRDGRIAALGDLDPGSAAARVRRGGPACAARPDR